MDELELFKKRLTDLLGNSELTEVLKQLVDTLRPNTEIRRDVDQQRARHSRNEREHRRGTREDSLYINEENKIVNALLDLINNLEKDDLVDNFGKNLVENSIVNPIVDVNSVVNPDSSKKTTPTTWIRSNLGWILFISLIVVFILSLGSGVIPFKTSEPTDPEQNVNCDSSSLKNKIKRLEDTLYIYKDTMNIYKNRISSHQALINSLSRKNISNQSPRPDQKKDEQIKNLRFKIDSIEEVKTNIFIDLNECKGKNKKFELRVYAMLKYEAITKLEKDGVYVYALDEYNTKDGAIDYHKEDEAIAKKIKVILEQYYQTGLSLRPRPTSKDKGIIIFHSPYK